MFRSQQHAGSARGPAGSGRPPRHQRALQRRRAPPYPLKMKAKGNVLPQQDERRFVFTPMAGHIERFLVRPNEVVYQGQQLVLMSDTDVKMKISDLEHKIKQAEEQVN